MGLFTNPEDMRLPTLTVIVQLKPEDVFDFLKRGFFQSCDRSNTISGLVVVFRGMSPEQIQTAMEMNTATILEVRDLADKIMRQRAEFGKTHIRLLEQFNSLYQKHSVHSHISVLGEGFDADGYTKKVVIVRSSSNILSSVLLIVLDDLSKIMNDELPVKICPECGFPFPVNTGKRSHSFCSNRCGNRERTRRYHRNKKISLVHADSMVQS